jgi:hypothetical protein
MALVQIEETAVQEYQEAFAKLEDELEAAKKELELVKTDLKFYKDQIPDKARVILSRKWHQPEITIEYNLLGVRIFMSAEDYIKSVIHRCLELHAPTGWKKYINWHFPLVKDLENWMLGTVQDLEEELKNSTVYFPPQKYTE